MTIVGSCSCDKSTQKMPSFPPWSTGGLKDGHGPGKVMFQAILQQLLYCFLILHLACRKAGLQNCIFKGLQDPATKITWYPVVKPQWEHSFLLSNSRLQKKNRAVPQLTVATAPAWCLSTSISGMTSGLPFIHSAFYFVWLYLRTYEGKNEKRMQIYPCFKLESSYSPLRKGISGGGGLWPRKGFTCNHIFSHAL